MKVSILTQPLGHNYGGLMQAYALQVYLASIGCEVETLDRRAPYNPASEAKKNLVNFLRLSLGRIKSMPTNKKNEAVFVHLIEFRNRHIKLSKLVKSERGIRRYYRTKKFDAVLVGSDQVWRPRYSPSLLNYYLDFLDDVGGQSIRLSYAASFGVDDWEHSASATEACQQLLKKFDAVSVREQSAIALCDQFLGFPDAKCVVDPTLLLEAKDYTSLIEPKSSKRGNPGVFVYVLNNDDEKRVVVDKVTSCLGLGKCTILPDMKVERVRSGMLQQCLYPRVEDWLRGFQDASFVVTDSFHGCVFAILFNKPFVALDNPVRGSSRISSLLRMFGLEARLVISSETIAQLVSDPIDWDYVNGVRELKSDESKAFLIRVLKTRPEYD